MLLAFVLPRLEFVFEFMLLTLPMFVLEYGVGVIAGMVFMFEVVLMFEFRRFAFELVDVSEQLAPITEILRASPASEIDSLLMVSP